MNRKTANATLFLLLAFLLTACGGAGGIVVDDAWGRSSPQAAANGAFYMTITNNSGSDDALLGARAAVCATAELHEMIMGEESIMRMRPVSGSRIPLPAGETVTLEVGGLHVMCLEKSEQFDAGDTFPITLIFEAAGEMEIVAEIRE